MPYSYSKPLRGLPARAAAFFTQRLAQAGAGLLLALLPLVASAQATPPAWQVALSGNNNQPGTGGTSLARATAVDASGNVFITGSFTGTVSFGSTRLVNAGTGATVDIFVAKWDATAQAFTWATSGGGTGNDIGNGIAVSGAGVYVTGYFASGTSANIAGRALAGTGTSNSDVFVAKYVDTSTGSTAATSSFANAWVTSGGGTDADIGNGIAVSGAGVYVTGYFTSGTSANIAGQPLAGTGTSNNDVFVAKYVDTSTGSTAATSSFANAWATSGGGTGTDIGQGIAVSGAGVYVTGYFGSASSASLAGQPLAGAGNADVFVAKYVDTSTGSTAATSSVANAWATSGGGTGNDIGNGIAVSGAGVYVTGYFTSGISASLAGQALAGAGGLDVFVAKYVDTSTGSTAATSSFANAWVTSGGGTGADIGQGIAVSGTDVYVTGYFASGTSASLAGQPLAGTGTSNNDVFVAKYVDTSTGSTAATSSVANGWATSGGGTGGDIGFGIAVSGTGVYAAGQVGTGIGSFGAAPNTRYAPVSSAVLGTLSPAAGTWQQADGPLQGGTSLARATAVDASGNVFVTGSFTVSVGFGSTRLVSAGNTDVFVAKWDATAQAFTWATSGGGTSQDVGNGIAVSGAGVYVTGYFTSASSASIAGQPLAGAGNLDVFVAKYVDTSTGSTAATSSFANGWVTSGGGTGTDIGNGIAVSGTGVYVTGYFTSGSSANIAGQPLAGTGTSNNDVFVAKYVDTSTGSTAATSSVANGWATSGGGTGGDIGNGIAVSGAGVYVTGYFGSNTSASFAGQPLAGTGTNNTNIFVAKYVDTSTGSTAATSSVANGWATSGGGTGNDIGNGIAVSGAGVYVTGYFASGTSASLAGQPLAGTGTSNNDVFVAKYVDTSTGSTAATSSVANGWATSGGGTGNDIGFGIAVSGAGVYVTGSFTSGSSANIAGQPLAGTGTNNTNIFVAKYVDTSTGSTAATSSFANAWATSGGGTGADIGQGIAVSGQRVYAAGYVAPPVTFGSLTFGAAASGQLNFLSGLTDTTPTLVSLTPASGAAGSTLAATGTNLAGATAITFTSGGGTATAAPTGYVVASDGMGITGIVVPPGLALGTYTVTVTTPTGTSNRLTYTVAGPPTLAAVAPNPGGLGQAITLTGTDLNNPTDLTINGANALAGLVSNSGTSLVVRVPLGAASAGTVSVTTAQGTATLPFSVLAAPGNALAFDGVNDYVRPAGTLPATGEFTLEAWVNPTALTNQFNALVLADNFAGGAMHCQFYGNRLGFTVNGNSPTDVISDVALPLDRWAHVAVVYSASAKTVQFYLNGVLVTTGTYATAIALGAQPYSVGAWLSGGSPQRAFNGKLDELRIYSAALTAAQVQADMLSTAPAVPASLALYLNMDQGTPAGANAGLTTLYDLSSSATPATLTNFGLSSGNTSSNYVQSYALVVPTATAATSQTNTSFIATWAAPANGTVTSYLLDVATTADFSAPVAGSPFAAPASATSYGVTDLAPGTTYYYRVRALNSNLAQPDQGAYSLGVATTTAAPLPVTLVAFTAVAAGPAAVRLGWATATEKNSARFEVERSLDGIAFYKVGVVAAAGTTAAARTYALTDAALPCVAATLYYRLRQVDLDGTATYSPMRSVAVGAAGLALFPNPTHGAATLSGATASAPVQVLDALGRVVATATADAAGVARVPGGLLPGVYVVRSGAHAARLTVE